MRTVGLSMLAALGVLFLAGCTQQQPEPSRSPQQPEVLSATEAGGLYLESVCPLNEAWGMADVELDRLRIAHARGEGDSEEFARAMHEVESLSTGAAKKLDPKGYKWPAGSVDEVEAVRKSLTKDAKEAVNVSEMTVAEIASYSWKGAEEAGRTATEARAALGLPDDPALACAQWSEQRETGQAQESTPGGRKDQTQPAGSADEEG